MVNQKPKEAKLEGKVVRLVWSSADDLPALYSNHLLVTYGGGSEFHIIFGHLTPPLVVTESPEDIPDVFTIKPIAKIVVTPQTMNKFIDVMTKNLERFEERKKEANDAS